MQKQIFQKIFCEVVKKNTTIQTEVSKQFTLKIY